ncbi:MAG: hypothetical protein Q7J44_14845 [Pseudotabrizicola sp.]|uniref:hypothetical protein n=1 Tax=Pseudotabrizicola sp. TaxID=2939647 RepID=UPI0027290D69|nr:hypothetical protein [Pseudotabrizicola sp.]MDO9639814.1 hypothetical protein [Pseudotabrizicola sp.]
MEYNAATDSFVTDDGRHISARGMEQGTAAFHARSIPQPTAARTEVGYGREVTIGHDGMTTHRDSPSGASFSFSEQVNPAIPATTIQTKSGSPVLCRAPQGSDTIIIKGQRASLDVFASLGEITRTPDGGFIIPGGAAPGPFVQGDAGAPETSPQQQPQTNPEATPTAPWAADRATSAVVNELASTLPAPVTYGLMDDYAKTGTFSETELQDAANASGQPLEAIRGKLEAAQAGMEAAVYSRLEGLGVHDHDLFSDYCQGHPQRALEAFDALRTMVATGDASGFDKLAQGYASELGGLDPQSVATALQEAGIKFTYDRSTFDFIIEMDGMTLPYKQAVRNGMVKVSRI